MKKGSALIIGISALFLILGGCCKDKATVPLLPQICYNDTTQSFLFKDSILEWADCVFPNGDLPGQQFQYDFPCFNPTNPNQFCYVRTEYNKNEPPFFKYGLFTHDFCNNTTQQISDGNVSGFCQWGKNGWILYTGQDLQLYKIKSNGDSLSCIGSDGGIYAHALWSDDETKIVYRHQGSFIMNSLGVVLGNVRDNLGAMHGYAYDWSGNTLLLQQSEELLSLFNLETKNYTELFKTDLSSNVYSPLDAKFFNNNKEFMWVTLRSINRYNLESGQNTEILVHTPTSYERFSPWLVNFAVSPDNHKIIFSRIDRHPRDGTNICDILAKQNLCIMNTDGTEMRMLILP
jgi:hypothetical protein